MGAINFARVNNNFMSTGSERLSSGLRINSAVDDPSGLAITVSMKSRSGGDKVANENAQEAINYLQVRDSAMSEIGDMLQRIRDLAVRAANDATLTSDDMQRIQDEAVQIGKNIDVINSETKFNGKRVFNHSLEMVQGWAGPYGLPGHPGQVSFTLDLASLAAANGGVAVVTSAWYNGDNDFPDLNIISPSGEAFGYYHDTYTGMYEAYLGGGGAQTIDSSVIDSADQINYNGWGPAASPGGWFEEFFEVTNPEAGLWTILIDNESPSDRYFGMYYNGETVEDPTVYDSAQIGPDNLDCCVVHLDMFQVSSVTLGVSTSMSTATAAAAAIDSADAAIDKLNNYRAKTGTLINQIEYIINDNTAQIINIEASRSRIEDSEMASEITKYTKTQIIQQTNTQALNKSDRMSESVLNLIEMSTGGAA